MKKILTMAVILTVSVFMFVGCVGSGSEAGVDTSLTKVKSAGIISIGIDDTYPPMEFKDSTNTIKGFDIDMANAVGKKMGVKVKYVPTTLDGIFLALNSKKFDAVQSSISITGERKKTMIFTKPYIYGGNAVFVRTKDNAISSEKDLNGKILGIEIGSTSQEVLNKISGIKEIKKYNSTTEAFMDLKTGRVDGVVSDPQVGDYYISDKKSDFKRSKTMLNQEPIGACFRKSDIALRDAYQKAIDQLKADGTLSKLSIKWFAQDLYN
ncbi:ABC transporter substrate-binding protein [Clostridium akagii]|uniref:ABC transporter substrate-binding protein n=1 Tax=Clostridium akagii TaxID=91623 RepID=UPI000479E7D3|nr:ABC transporter substrate-binding protein [Clostridium akagii]